MSGLVLLTVLSVAGAVALFVALAAFLASIIRELEAIGGSASRFATPTGSLTYIRVGVRAIETQTGGLAPRVSRLNGGLAAVRDDLRAVDANLAAAIRAVAEQEGR